MSHGCGEIEATGDSVARSALWRIDGTCCVNTALEFVSFAGCEGHGKGDREQL